MCLAVISGLNAALALNERLQDPIACLKKILFAEFKRIFFQSGLFRLLKCTFQYHFEID